MNETRKREREQGEQEYKLVPWSSCEGNFVEEERKKERKETGGENEGEYTT